MCVCACSTHTATRHNEKENENENESENEQNVNEFLDFSLQKYVIYVELDRYMDKISVFFARRAGALPLRTLSAKGMLTSS